MVVVSSFANCRPQNATESQRPRIKPLSDGPLSSAYLSANVAGTSGSQRFVKGIINPATLRRAVPRALKHSPGVPLLSTERMTVQSQVW